jgi:Xaa-Pro aminopeptidase
MPDQKAAYESVLVAELAAIDACKPGASFNEVHMAAVRSLSASLVELGVLKESVEEIVEKELYKPWYLHNTSHWIGLDVHDAGRYKNGEEFRSLEAGMCLTVEPGLYFAENDERVPKALRGMGIRIEDDILITPGGNENLTLAAPKTVEDVEAACSAARVMPPVLDTELVAK